MWHPVLSYLYLHLVIAPASERQPLDYDKMRHFDKMAMPPEPPPPFGHHLRQYFGFEADYINMNSGQPHSLSLHARKNHVCTNVFVQVPTASCRTQF